MSETAAYHQSWRATSRYATLAHQYVTIAIRAGHIAKLDGSVRCADCGDVAVEYDHRDYLKPLSVDPVCKACNQARGPGINRDPIAAGAVKPKTIAQRYRAGELSAGRNRDLLPAND